MHTIRIRPRVQRWLAVVATLSGVGVGSLAVATPAFADTAGSAPTVGVVCGPTLDNPNAWTVKAETLPGGMCAPHFYAYIFTSGSIQHTASWPMHIGTPGGIRGYHLEAWIPSLGAGQHVQYSVEYCESMGTWDNIGTLFQENDTGWFTPGEVFVDPDHTICAIREQNTGTQSWDMAADVVGLLPI